MLKKAVMICALALPLGAAQCNVNPEVATPNQEYIAVQAYNAAVGAGTVYLRRPLCPQAAPLCRTQNMSQKVYNALRSGRVARKVLMANLAAGQPASLTAIQTLQASYDVLSTIQ